MSETTAIFLAKHELSSYTAAFDEHGWDSLPALQDISDDDLKQLAVRRAERHAVYVCRGYTADYTAKNRGIALYSDTHCLTALQSYTAIQCCTLYSCTALYTIQVLQHPSGWHGEEHTAHHRKRGRVVVSLHRRELVPVKPYKSRTR